MPKKRPIVQLVFGSDATAPVLDWMVRLAEAHDGWINLLPGVPEDQVAQPRIGAFSALFDAAQPLVSMSTWIPAPAEPSGIGEATVGIMHQKGGRAASELSTKGVALPSTWRVRQDHVRRGLVVSPSPGAPHADVLAWTLRAGAALTVLPMTGSWQARIYLPRDWQ